MTKTQLRQDPAERDRESQRDESQLLEAVVRDNVLAGLGRPADLHHVQVRRVWGDNYRVNVFVGPDATSLTVPHSYFLSADGDGRILHCCPPLVRSY